MLKKSLSFLLVLLLLLSSALAEGSFTVTDRFGREITLDGPVTRIVALTAADCEILCALGCEDALAGVGAYCDYPPSIADLPVVESGLETNLEQILALEPQVVLMSDMNQSLELVEALEAAGVRVVENRATDIEGVYAGIAMIGELMNRTAEADALVTDMRSAFDAIASQAENSGKTVYFEVSPLEWGLWTAGANTFLDELASLCGLTNAFADVDGWCAISEEQVLARDPDYIVTTATWFGEGPTPVEEIMARPGWDSIRAVAEGRVFNADPNETSRPGPRLKDAAEALYEFISK